MIRNVDSYTSSITGQEHNLTNCVHKHSKKMLDAEMNTEAEQQAAVQKIEENRRTPLEYLSDCIRKALGNGAGFLRGVWSESAEEGKKDEVRASVKEEMQQEESRAKGTGATAAILAAMGAVADIKLPKRAEVAEKTEKWKLSAAIPALRVKTGQARKRFEAGKDAFLKRMKEMAKNRKEHSFSGQKEEESPGQQEKDMEWLEVGNSHLLDSYDRNGEYTNLGNRKEGTGYSGSPVKDNYSRKV